MQISTYDKRIQFDVLMHSTNSYAHSYMSLRMVILSLSIVPIYLQLFSYAFFQLITK